MMKSDSLSAKSSFRQSRISKILVSACLVLVSFIETCDGRGVDGIIPLLQQNFNVNDAQTATIGTISSIAHTITLALTWILGDFFERRKLFLISIGAWIILSLLAIILGSQTFLIFVAFRSLAASASSVFAVLTPVMLADLWKDRALGGALMVMSAGDLIAPQLTTILNSWIVTSGVPWQSLLIVLPLIALVPLVGLICSMITTRSGDSQRRSLQRSFVNAFTILSNKSYVLLTAERSLRAFFNSAFWFWYPTMLLSAWTYSPSSFLGLSYTTVTTLSSVMKITGTVIGLPMSLWFAQSWRHGTGPFNGRGGNAHAYAIVACVGASIKTLSYVAGLLLLLKNYVAFLVFILLIGLGSASIVNLTQLMMLMVVPASSRPSAVALSKLISVIAIIPSAQLTGLISDAVRGESSLSYDRFRSYQFALLCMVSFSFASVFCDMSLIVFFPGDSRKVEEKEEEVEDDETTSLIVSPKLRSESVLDTFIRSRATTLSSY